MTLRGLVKIEAGGGGGLFWDAISMIDVLAEYAPIVQNLMNWTTSRRGSYSQFENLRDTQQFTAYLKGGYALYAEDLEILFHGKETEGYMGIDSTQNPVQNVQASGGSINQKGTYPEVMKTNVVGYREIKFKTTISVRDKDLPIYGTEALHKHDIAAFPGQFLHYSLDWLVGGQGLVDLKGYYEKRANFLMDLRDVEVTASSTMFNKVTGYIDADRMTMQSGQTEAQFDIGIKEVVDTKVAESNDSFRAVAVEPGLGWSH
jgi:hypothetical protein